MHCVILDVNLMKSFSKRRFAFSAKKPSSTLPIAAALLLCCCIACCVACSDDETYSTSTDDRLTFEVDTVTFDTVFSTIGSSTQRVKVYNKNSKALRIAQAYLASGGESGFQVNIDGQSGTLWTDVEIWHEDSVFVFVQVTVNPQDENSPVLITDSLVFLLESGIRQQMILQAWGQDVVILSAEHITENAIFSGERPYVVYDSLIVDSGALLYIDAGGTLCFHSGAYLGVYGQLWCQGTVDAPVTFRGDRTDKMFSYLPYDRLDAQWGGITLYPTSGDNYFANVDIHSGNYGIRCPLSTYEGTKIEMVNSQIHNVSGEGLYLTYCAALFTNCLFSNAGSNCVSLIGGAAEFTHCTLAQCYPWDADYGYALFFTNVLNDTIYPLEQADFHNCLITGRVADAIQGNALEDSDAAFNAQFVGCLINISLTGDEGEGVEEMFTDCINECDLFSDSSEDGNEAVYGTAHFRTIDDDTYYYDFRLDTLSTARGIGNASYAATVPYDKDGNERPSQSADAGCYQFTNY